VQHGDRVVAWQRIFPRLKLRVPDLCADEIHLADAPLILLKGRDLLRIRRPHDDRPIALRPAGVVGGVAEVLDAVGRERGLPSRFHVAQPEIPVANEDGAFAVRRRRRDDSGGPASPTPATSSTAAPAGSSCSVLRGDARRQCAGLFLSDARIDDERFVACGRGHAVPEAIIGKPRRADARSKHQRRRVPRHELFGARVVGGRQCTRGRRLPLIGAATHGPRTGNNEGESDRSNDAWIRHQGDLRQVTILRQRIPDPGPGIRVEKLLARARRAACVLPPTPPGRPRRF